MKLLVNAPTGLQELIEVGAGGEYFDPARVVWNERVDGEMPAVTLGGMVRSGNPATLVLDNNLLAADAAIRNAAAATTAARAGQEKDTADAIATTKADATIQYLLTHTLAECAQFAQDNFPTLTAAEKAKLGKLFMVVAVFAKKYLR